MAHALPTYPERSKWTIHALWFLLGPITLYEVWAVVVAPRIGAPSLVAHSVISAFFHRAGFSWAFMPGLVAVVSLLAVHVAENIRAENRHRLWTPPEPLLYALMLLESLGWSIPLFVIGAVLSHMGGESGGSSAMASHIAPMAVHFTAQTQVIVHDPWATWRSGVMLSVGAGIFEELVFRLFGLNLFDLITSALFGKKSTMGMAVAMASTALLFAAAHFISASNGFEWPKAMFYFFGGVYFAVIYLWRGFGIAAATHVIFDVLVTTATLRGELA